jgi:hypothetical protein
MSQPAATQADPVKAVDAIVAPWLYGDWRSPVPPLGRLHAHPPFWFDGYVQGTLGPATIGTPAREVRAWMLKAAEDALDALAAAGWQLIMDGPAMEFSCELEPAVVFLGGELFRPGQQHSVSLRVRFGVSGPHLPEALPDEMAPEGQ